MRMTSNDKSDGRSASEVLGFVGDITYRYVHRTGILTISGKGAIGDRGSDGMPWDGCECTTILVQYGITSIGDFAFERNPLTERIGLPSTLVEVGDFAFSGCDMLRSISVDVINGRFVSLDGVLYDRHESSIVHVPFDIRGVVRIRDGITSIGARFFRNRWRMTSLIIPASVRYIESDSFHGCVGLEHVSVPDGLSYDFGSDVVVKTHATAPSVGECEKSVDRGLIRDLLVPVRSKPSRHPTNSRSGWCTIQDDRCDHRGMLVFDQGRIEAERRNSERIRELLVSDYDEMSLDDGPELPVAIVTGPSSRPLSEEVRDIAGDDVWKVFVDSLSVAHREHIITLLSGKPVTRSSGTGGSSIGIVENDINIIAQDVIDDVIIEDGMIVPEYLSELRRVLTDGRRD